MNRNPITRTLDDALATAEQGAIEGDASKVLLGVAVIFSALGLAVVGLAVGVRLASATSAGGTYTCFDGRIATEVVIHGKTLTPNFDAAQYTAPDGQVQAVHRLPDGTVPDLTFMFDGALAGPIVFKPHYTGPGGADGRTPLVVAHIDGDLPDCTPATTVAPTTSTTSPPTTSPQASTTTSPASSTTRPPASTVPPGSPSTTPGTSPRTLPPTGAPDATPVVFLGGALILGCGIAAVAVTRRRKP